MTTSGNDENTVARGVTGPHGAARLALPGEMTDALPPGTRLHEFEIKTVIGRGGFGIVYLARDHSLDRDVAIKEYMPSSLATRTRTMTVAVRSNRHVETFTAGLRSFINEARLLARFDHPSLLKVHRFWEANGTAYMAMPHYQGVTLRTLLAQAGRTLGEAELRDLLDPLLDALAQMHGANCFHRDIAPDNILILPDGRPLLLDFGAARRVIGGMTQALTVIVKAGYAPVEQYGDMPNLSQGAWTDLYALASVVEFAITGRTPPQAISRFLSDKRVPLATNGAGRYTPAFLRAIDKALAVLPKDRPQSAAELRTMLGMEEKAPWRTELGSRPMPLSSGTMPLSSLRQASSARKPGRRVRWALGSALALILLAGSVLAAIAWLDKGMATSPAGTAHVDEAPNTAAATPTDPAPSVPITQVARPDLAPVEAMPSPPSEKLPSASEKPAEPVPPPSDVAVPLTKGPAAPPKKTRPATSRAAAMAAPRTVPALPYPTPSNPRCADIIQRVSLGEVPTAAEKALLTGECAK